MEILKVFFVRSDDGAWVIRGMGPLSLMPARGCNGEFYKVEDELFLCQPNFLSTVRAVIGQSIVPIVVVMPGENLMRCLGTGFFISCSGLLLTAAHVITDPIERKYGGVKEVDSQNWDFSGLDLGVMIPTNPLFGPKSYTFHPIEWSCFLGEREESPLPFMPTDFRLTSDTAICKVAPKQDGSPFDPLPIIQPGIRGVGLGVGKRAFAVGYGDMKDISFVEKLTKRSGAFNFDVHVSAGLILERFPENRTSRQATTPGPCFSASLRLPGGMSGSPIFDDERIYVHGVVSRGLEDTSGPAAFGHGAMLSDLLTVPVKLLDGKTILELMSESEHGIPKMSVPGA